MTLLKLIKTPKKGNMSNNLEKEYTVLFYNKNKIVGATNFITTKSNVRAIGKVFANSTGDYLPNKGNYDTVGWISNTSIQSILDKAISESTKTKDKGN